MEAARKHLPGEGWCFFDVRHEFPDAWQMLRKSPAGRMGATRGLACGSSGRCSRSCPARRKSRFQESPCYSMRAGTDAIVRKPAIARASVEREADCRVLEFTHRHAPMAITKKVIQLRVPCVRSEEWADLYYALIETHDRSARKTRHASGDRVQVSARCWRSGSGLFAVPVQTRDQTLRPRSGLE